jgi:predicted benzoate:H+ symporter BenE
MIQFSPRYGIMLLCGWLPPTGGTIFALIGVRGEVAVLYKRLEPVLANELLAGVFLSAFAEAAIGVWL